ncbi:MAG: glycoside hydrolase family 2 TIM barrel-domain containing protein [Candidatus Hydrogenedentota bacterium]
MIGCGSSAPPPPAPVAAPVAAAAVTDPYTELMKTFMAGYKLPVPKFTLAHPGLDGPVDYEKFGKFKGVGTNDYQYEISDFDGLKVAVGEGIFPNQDKVRDDPAYGTLSSANKLAMSHWDAEKSGNFQAAFFVWAQASEDPGVKAFYTAVMLEKAGLLLPAVKAYHAAIVHYPRTYVWAANNSFVWYTTPVAMSSIQRICEEFPSLGLEYKDAKVEMENTKDVDPSNDIISVSPGRIVKAGDAAAWDPYDLAVAETRGAGKVQLVKFTNGHWQLRVDGKAFVVRSASYSPTMVGLSPLHASDFAKRWMFADADGNGKNDAAYDAWVDRNGNGAKDENEPAVGDFQLMKDMGLNVIRLYISPDPGKTDYDPSVMNKDLLRDLFKTYGIRVMVGDFLGAYCIGSGAGWEAGTDYTDSEQRRKLKEYVRAKVTDLKDEPFVLLWILGNENNMPAAEMGVNASRTNAGSHPAEYAKFLNEVAEMIHEIDPDHPVAIGNLETFLADVYSQHAPAIDIFGVNAYRGEKGFGDLWSEVKRKFDRPVLITEYGCDAYYEGRGPDYDGQARYHEGALRDIVLNQAGGRRAGNSIGGSIFQFMDEWWKDTHGDDKAGTKHDVKSNWGAPFPDGQGHEEWFGIVGQGEGKNSPFERQLRKAYDFYLGVW